MKDARDRPIDLVAEMLRTPGAERPARLDKLAKPVLVRIAAAALEGWSRERAAREGERDARAASERI